MHQLASLLRQHCVMYLVPRTWLRFCQTEKASAISCRWVYQGSLHELHSWHTQIHVWAEILHPIWLHSMNVITYNQIGVSNALRIHIQRAYFEKVAFQFNGGGISLLWYLSANTKCTVLVPLYPSGKIFTWSSKRSFISHKLTQSGACACSFIQPMAESTFMFINWHMYLHIIVPNCLLSWIPTFFIFTSL